jgi:predicted SnoaL-like aldol condensation-catalyzing enzyme
MVVRPGFFLAFAVSRKFSSPLSLGRLLPVYSTPNHSRRYLFMSASQAVSNLDQNKRLVSRWFHEVWNEGRRDTIAELFAHDGVMYDGTTVIRGPAEFEGFYDRLRAQFSQFHISPVLVLAEGDLACIHWNASFKHTATDKPAHITGTSIVRVKDGRFVEAWQNWDAAGLAAQLSGQPPPALF